MAVVTLSVPEILVNDEKIVIVPNSFSYDRGEPEINVRAASVGNNGSESVHGVNAETGFTEIMFSLFVTNTTDELIRIWKQEIGNNTVTAIQAVPDGSDIILTFPGQSLTNKPTREASADGTVEIEFKGDAGI